MTEIPLKPKNDQNKPENLKIDQKYLLNLKNDWNIPSKPKN